MFFGAYLQNSKGYYISEDKPAVPTGFISSGEMEPIRNCIEI